MKKTTWPTGCRPDVEPKVLVLIFFGLFWTMFSLQRAAAPVNISILFSGGGGGEVALCDMYYYYYIFFMLLHDKYTKTERVMYIDPAADPCNVTISRMQRGPPRPHRGRSNKCFKRLCSS